MNMPTQWAITTFIERGIEMSEAQARYKAALDLLRLKAIRQMCVGKTTCTIDESDIQEVLLVAGMSLDTKIELIDIKQKDQTTHE